MGGSSSRVQRTCSRLYLWAADRLYHEFAPFYDAVSWLVSAGRWARWRSIALDYVRGSEVLEVGFGTGELLREMVARKWSVVGVDASRAMQRVAARKLLQAGAPPRIQARVQALPFCDACRDTIISTFPAPYIVEPASLAEFVRVLRPGGSLVVVGLVVFSDRRMSGLTFRLESGAEPAIDRFRMVAEAAGMQVSILSRTHGSARLPVIIAKRNA